jgi:hypothetical protein
MGHGSTFDPFNWVRSRGPRNQGQRWSSSASGLLHTGPVCSIRSSTLHPGHLSPLLPELHAFHDDSRCSPDEIHAHKQSAKPYEEA